MQAAVVEEETRQSAVVMAGTEEAGAGEELSITITTLLRDKTLEDLLTPGLWVIFL
jgi:hypothetical protein